MSNKVKIWVQAFRLRTLPLAFSSTILAGFVALSEHNFKWTVLVFSLLTTLFLQILSNLANDYGDAQKGADDVNRLGPQRVTQSGLVSSKEMLRMIIVFVILSLGSGLALIYFGLRQLPFYLSVLFFALGIGAIFAAVKYTVGKNPYGYVGLGDVFVFLFFGLVGVCGTYFLHTGTFNPKIFLPAISIGLFSAAVLNLNNMRDIENDSHHGKKTIVVKYGIRWARFYHLALICGALVACVFYSLLRDQSIWQFLYLLSIPLLYISLKKVFTYSDSRELYPELKNQALITFFFSLTFGIGLLL